MKHVDPKHIVWDFTLLTALLRKVGGLNNNDDQEVNKLISKFISSTSDIIPDEWDDDPEKVVWNHELLIDLISEVHGRIEGGRTTTWKNYIDEFIREKGKQIELKRRNSISVKLEEKIIMTEIIDDENKIMLSLITSNSLVGVKNKKDEIIGFINRHWDENSRAKYTIMAGMNNQICSSYDCYKELIRCESKDKGFRFFVLSRREQ